MKYQFNSNWSLKADVGFVQTKFLSKSQENYDSKGSGFSFDNIVVPNMELNYISPNKKFRFTTGFAYYGAEAFYVRQPHFER